MRILPEEKDKQSAYIELFMATNKLVIRLNDNLQVALGNEIDIVQLTEGLARLQADIASILPKTKGLLSREAYLGLSQELSSEIKRTITLKMSSIANQNYIEAKYLRSKAEENYLEASKSGDKELIVSTHQLLLQAIEHEKQMKEIQEEFQLN